MKRDEKIKAMFGVYRRMYQAEKMLSMGDERGWDALREIDASLKKVLEDEASG